jgi:hypothetical protein
VAPRVSGLDVGQEGPVGLAGVEQAADSVVAEVRQTERDTLDPLDPLGEIVMILPVGTKPHALGMAVAAMRVGSSLLYRWPQNHIESPVGSVRSESHHVV